MTVTQAVILLCFGALLLYTAVASQIGQRAVSPTLRDWAWRFNSIAMTFGILMGHWFSPLQITYSHRVGPVIPFLGGTLLLDLYWIQFQGSRRARWRWPAWWLLLGIVIGAILWGQRSLEAPF